MITTRPGLDKAIRPTILMLFLASIGSHLGSASSAAAESFTTECPGNHPNAHEKILQSAQMLHATDGSWAAGDREMILENGDEHWIERHPKDQWWFHRAVLLCKYQAAKATKPEASEKISILRLNVPGVLREYHIVLRVIGAQSANDITTLRAWVVSADDPLSESPPGKLIPPK